MTDPMTREQIEALDGHTPGPWEAADDEQSTVLNAEGIPLAYHVAPRNKPVIAAAPALRTTCLALMAEVERLTKANANLHKLNREYRLRLNDQFHVANRAALQEQKP